MTRNYRPAAMRASHADRYVVVSDLSGHFQAGTLTAAELDAAGWGRLTARTWGELTELAADLPALRPAGPASHSHPRRRQVQPLGTPHQRRPRAGLRLAIAAVVLIHAVHGGWGLIWRPPARAAMPRRAHCRGCMSS